MWQYFSFEEAPIQIIDGDRGKNYPHQNDFSETGFCIFLNTKNVTSNGFELNGCQFISEQKDNQLRKGKLNRYDVVMTTRGTIGNVAYFHEGIEHENIRINSGMVILRAYHLKLLPSFLYSYLRSPMFTVQVNQLKSGVAQPQLPIRDINKIKIPIPDVETQEKTVDVIFKYDRAIANNRRRIELLERSARLLYKEWFVHLRFPGHEHVAIAPDGIPEGWEKKKLEEIADITMGQSPKSEFYNETGEGLPFHQGVSDFGFRFPINTTYSTQGTRIGEAGDILFSVRAPVGRINLNLEKIILGRGLAAIRSNANNSQNFLFYQLKNHFFKEDMIGGGAIFAAITKKDLHSVELIKPSETLIQVFSDQVIPSDDQIRNLYLQNQKLQEARDLLLPRLMNGEITV